MAVYMEKHTEFQNLDEGSDPALGLILRTKV